MAYLNRAVIRSSVEEYWKNLILNMRISPERALFVSAQFGEHIQAVAKLFSSPDEANAFLAAVEEERGMLVDEYDRDREGLLRRLGIDDYSQVQQHMVHYQRESIGEMAVRTAVRATIWEGIWSIFRGLR